MIKVRVVKRHSKGCTTARWYSTHKRGLRDTLGRETRHGRRRWRQFRCEDYTCPGETWVSEDSLDDVIVQAIEGQL